jgi:preprotein translocase subunit SecG
MAWWTSLLIVVQVIAAVSIIVLVLLQHGKGADMGAAFGSGASGSLFGASGAANFLSRTTGVMAAVFFVTTLALVYASTSMRGARPGGGGLMSGEARKADAAPKPASEVPGSTPAAATGDAKPAESKSDAPPPADAKNAPAKSSEVPK